MMTECLYSWAHDPSHSGLTNVFYYRMSPSLLDVCCKSSNIYTFSYLSASNHKSATFMHLSDGEKITALVMSFVVYTLVDD